ncbi:MAG: single-stranded DNA-binding protein [Planctomycetes bacterium]|nr:single-stranded DNA-binding protein [Planctomycetota bacterium]
MANYNRVILMGNLTRDPELSYTPNNTAICKFGMAINRNWNDQQGEKHEETCFVDCTAFGRRGETLNQYMSKGRPLLVEGRLSFSQWTSQEGQKRSKLEVIVENFQFLGGRRDDAQDQSAPSAAAAQGPGGGGYTDPGPPPAANHDGAPGGGEGDIPF